MLYEHNDWKVEVIDLNDPENDDFYVAFRRTIREDQECELFTLLQDDSDDARIQIRLYDDGTSHSEVYEPMLVRAIPAIKGILINLYENSTI